MKFTVKWEVEFYDHDLKLYCDIDESGKELYRDSEYKKI